MSYVIEQWQDFRADRQDALLKELRAYLRAGWPLLPIYLSPTSVVDARHSNEFRHCEDFYQVWDKPDTILLTHLTDENLEDKAILRPLYALVPARHSEFVHLQTLAPDTFTESNLIAFYLHTALDPDTSEDRHPRPSAAVLDLTTYPVSDVLPLMKGVSTPSGK